MNGPRRTAVPGGSDVGDSAVSIVVISHNERDTLRPTVEALRATTAGAEVSIVVVDDASSDGSTEWLADGFEGVQLVRSEARLGIARARNVGACTATGSVIVFSDAHVIPDPGWLEPLCRELENPSVGQVAPAVGIRPGSDEIGYGFTWCSPDLKMEWLEMPLRQPQPVPFLCGCFTAMRRDVFERCHGFDEGLTEWGFEDSELSLRLWRQGWQCRVVPTSRITHLFREHFPYQIEWAPVVHNALRTAMVHLSERGLTAVIDEYRDYPDFAQATSRLAASDVWYRREQVNQLSRVDTNSILERFKIDVVV
jgi:GT2 family glycosyltransferase